MGVAVRSLDIRGALSNTINTILDHVFKGIIMRLHMGLRWGLCCGQVGFDGSRACIGLICVVMLVYS